MTNAKRQAPTIPLPRTWPESVKSAVLHVISLAQFAAAHTRGWSANSPNARIRLTGKSDRDQQEVQLCREEIRIKDVRMEQVPASRRPHYPPVERMAILELKAARHWSLEQTARTFLLTPATIASWLQRVDEKGPTALVQLPQPPVNKFPEYVKHVVRRLKTLCPMMGKVKIAEILARAGLHLGATTVGRMLKSGEDAAELTPAPNADPVPDGDTNLSPEFSTEMTGDEDVDVRNGRVVTAKYPNHLWHTDLTLVPTALGFWTSWLPFTLPQSWPFCWWIAVAIDHFSRRVMGVTVFRQQPTSVAIRTFLGRTIAKAGIAPKYIVCDRGPQFDCKGFRDWCQRSGIKSPRYGAIGQHGSIAVVERFILTMKCLLAGLLLVPYRRESLRRELDVIVEWYNACRPHTWLGGKTPDERYGGKYPANRRPRFESRSRWPRGSPCAKPWALLKGQPGIRLELKVTFHKGRKHLPVVTLQPAA